MPGGLADPRLVTFVRDHRGQLCTPSCERVNVGIAANEQFAFQTPPILRVH